MAEDDYPDHSSAKGPLVLWISFQSRLWAAWVFLWKEHRRLVLLSGLVDGLVAVLYWMPVRTRLALMLAIQAQRLLLTLVVGFVFLSLSLIWSASQTFDRWIFLYFNLHGYHSLRVDRFMWGITQVGNGLIAFCGSALLYWIGYRRLAIEILLGTLTLWIMVELIKALTDRTRPYIILTEARVIGRRERGRSFPSGHTSQTFFIMSFLTQYFHLPIYMGIFLYGTAILVGFTRIYVGAHYPRDVFAGAILGSAWTILLLSLAPHLPNRLF